MTSSPASSRIICITGTDTDAGKSLVTSALLRALTQLGKRSQAIKAVQTGCTSGPTGLEAPDVALYKDAAPGASSRAILTFREPCSPHLAARIEERDIDTNSLLARIRQEADGFPGVTLVEGAGGLFVPLNDRECFVDLFARLRAPLVLVAPNRLGAINHSLLSLEAIGRRGLPVLGTVLSTCRPVKYNDILSAAMEKDNPEIIARVAGIRRPISLPYIAGLHSKDAGERKAAWDAAGLHLLPLAQEISTL